MNLPMLPEMRLDPRYGDLIFDHIPHGIFTVDETGHITSFNRAAEEITGWSRGEAMGRPCREIFRSNQSSNGDGRDKQKVLATEFDLSGGLAYSHARADGYLRAARACLDGLPEGEYVEALRAMTDFVLHRRN